MRNILIILLFPFFCSAQGTVIDGSGNIVNYLKCPDTVSVIATATKLKTKTDSLAIALAATNAALLALKLNISDTATMVANYTRKAVPLFTNGFGYTTGAGGTVTQATSKTTAVTLNKITGRITMSGAALAAGAEAAFTLTNSTISATDVIIINVQSVGTAGAYLTSVGAVANGSCSITVSNASAGSLSQAVVLNFAVIKSVIN